MINNYI